MVDIGKTLKEYFDRQGVTQQSIANTMGVSKAYVNRLSPLLSRKGSLMKASFFRL